MAIDFDKRLRNLRERRLGGTAPLMKSFAAADSLGLLKEEAYQRRAGGRGTKYALGAMQAVDGEYTKNSFAEADRVQQQLSGALENIISVEFRYQGSVPLDIHIRGVSDVDMLVLRDDFRTYDRTGASARAGLYANPMTDTPVSRLQWLRSRCETILTEAYPAADVDISGSKSIALSGGSLRRKIDVVPSHWHDTVAYQASYKEYERGVRVLVKDEHKTAHNLPFVHMHKINHKDLVTWGGAKKLIRLLKNLKNDSDYAGLITLTSYDIASLVWQLPDSALQVVAAKELSLIADARDHLRWYTENKAAALDLQTPDGTRKIIDSELKFSGLRLLYLELEQLAEGVASEWISNALIPAPSDQRLRNAYIPV